MQNGELANYDVCTSWFKFEFFGVHQIQFEGLVLLKKSIYDKISQKDGKIKQQKKELRRISTSRVIQRGIAAEWMELGEKERAKATTLFTTFVKSKRWTQIQLCMKLTIPSKMTSKQFWTWKDALMLSPSSLWSHSSNDEWQSQTAMKVLCTLFIISSQTYIYICIWWHP